MASPGKDQPTFKDNLIREGIAPDEIQKVYKTLKEKGYGDEEARRRSRAALERLKAQREMEERRKASAASAPRIGAATRTSSGPLPVEAESARRAVDMLPEVPPWLRRKINRYAFRGGFLITRVAERWSDFRSYFDAKRPDFVSGAFLRLMADARGYRGANPYRLSFVDNLDALHDSAARLLGVRPAALDGQSPVIAALKAKEPFAVAFFSAFTQPQDMLRRSLDYLEANHLAHSRVPVSALARVVKDGYRLFLITDALEKEKLETLLDIVRQANLEHQHGAAAAQELTEAEGLFRACFQNLRRFAHELYPALLKMIAAFFEESDGRPEKIRTIWEFVGVREEDLLAWEGWQRRMEALREKELREKQERELAKLEQEKTEQFSQRFEGTLTMMSSVFPGSGVERIEQGAFLLPYFAHRIFGRTSVFQARATDIEKLSSADVMSLVIVLHSILDDMLSSLDAYALEKIVGREGLAAEMVGLRDSWRDAYPKLFEPYLDAVGEFSRETGGNIRYALLFRESARARSIEEKINQLRARAIRHFGHVFTERDQFDGPKLYELAARLSPLLTEAGEAINQAALAAEDPVSRKVIADLRVHGIVDFVSSARTGTVDYRPVTRQIKRWIEARFRETVLEIPQKAQVAFMDAFRGVAYMYDSLLNEPTSPALRAGHSLVTASTADHEAWAREQSVGARDSMAALQATLMEQFPGQFVDALTGLKNKDYFLNELPRHLKRLRAHRAPLAFLMIDIDHFKWVNDALGHPRGDEVLQATAGMILDNVREGDLAVRYGGEEILIVVPSDLHTGIILAERLRFAQESRVLARDAMQDVRKVGEEGGAPCGTLSIGVAEVGGIVDVQKAVEKVDKALYAAKLGRNAVVFVDPEKGDKAVGNLTSYTEYRKKAGSSPAL